MTADSSEVTINNVVNFSYFDAINRRYWDQRFSFDNFNTNPVTSKVGGGAATGVAGDNNILTTRFGLFEWFVIGTQTILAPKIDAFGLNLVQDAAVAGDGIELCQGVTALSVATYIVGTDPAFYMRCTFKVQDASGTNPLIIGFRKVAAFNATLSSYTDFVSIGIVGTANPNTIKTQTQVASGGVVTTDTTQTVADGAITTFAIYVDAKGAVTYTINDAPPTVIVGYTFTAGTNVIPFVRFTQAADITTQASCNWYEVGFTAEPFVA
jgi:hypothetical protein